jgi:hypothetical protein
MAGAKRDFRAEGKFSKISGKVPLVLADGRMLVGRVRGGFIFDLLWNCLRHRLRFSCYMLHGSLTPNQRSGIAYYDCVPPTPRSGQALARD